MLFHDKELKTIQKRSQNVGRRTNNDIYIRISSNIFLSEIKIAIIWLIANICQIFISTQKKKKHKRNSALANTNRGFPTMRYSSTTIYNTTRFRRDVPKKTYYGVWNASVSIFSRSNSWLTKKRFSLCIQIGMYAKKLFTPCWAICSIRSTYTGL